MDRTLDRYKEENAKVSNRYELAVVKLYNM